MRRPAARRKAGWPLRRVLGVVEETMPSGVGLLRERLECGHVVPIREDIFGRTNAYRRRCRRCAAVKASATGRAKP